MDWSTNDDMKEMQVLWSPYSAKLSSMHVPISETLYGTATETAQDNVGHGERRRLAIDKRNDTLHQLYHNIITLAREQTSPQHAGW